MPSAGRIMRRARVSFPVGYLGGFTPDLSVRHNVAHVARLYGADVKSVVAFVARVGQFGRFFDKPYRDLPGPLKNQLGIIMTYGIPFDVYLLPAEFNRGKGAPQEFQQTASELFEARAQSAGMIMAVNNLPFARQYCDMGLIVHGGQVLLFDDLERAIAASESLPVAEPVAR